MTSCHFQSFFIFRPPDPKSEKNPLNQLIKQFWPYYCKTLLFGVFFSFDAIGGIKKKCQNMRPLNTILKQKTDTIVDTDLYR